MLKNKKILYFHQYFSTRNGATGTRSYEFAKQLIAENFEVTMVCGSSQLTDLGKESASQENGRIRSYLVDGIHVIEFPLNYSNKDSFFLRTLKFLKFSVFSIKIIFKEKYDLVFATSTPLTIAIPGIVAKFILKKTFIFEVRDLWPELPKAMGVVKNVVILWVLDLLERVAYMASDHIIALSPGIKNGIEKKVKNKKVTLIPNGSDLDLFFPQNKIDFEIPNIEKEDFVAIFTGAHGMANGLDTILVSADILQKKGINRIKFFFIGDGKEKKTLQEYAMANNLKNCIFLDPVSKLNLNTYLSRADIGLMILKNIPAFYYGTSPNKYFDYLAAGLPIFCNYPGWIADMIKEYNIGFVVPPDDPHQLSVALEEIMSFKGQLTEKGINARKLAENKFDRRMLSKKFSNIICSYLNN
ncbi:MAG: glycosyltransferase family 4 protein [Bdellovibrionaceae bacterium]|nr:glycosyltransferase family 4 protein [Pseudobdellovibrionaceae bacterium]